ncbi:SH3 domain-containing protein [Spirulina sp. CS-785/01]|uniref:SH3 domain-containing protein n=1 Tax=Spirulina sp. CS-785/01 TaxID=3021716 RepID=UPI0023313DEE|nr:SH3 domain-containing protein [Spirulina sp. CS-785/01]MDB9313448.1 SH3 domain-containing protein [Spirulina sp. CS-785/01]
MNFSKIAQFILGVISGLFLLGISGAATGYYFFSRMAADPPRPVFSEERPGTETDKDSDDKKAPKPETVAEDQKAAAEAAKEPKEEEPEEPEEPEEELEPGAYRAQVTWPDGLSLRDEPSLEAERIGGIAYENEMIILDTSDDGRWERVRLPGTEQEGWVKAGNSEPIEEEE